MNAYILIPVIEAVFGIALLVILLVSGLRHIARIPFALFLAFMSLWGFFIFMMRSSPDLQHAFFWEKFVLAAIISAPLFFYKFTLSFTGTTQRKRTLYTLYSLYVIFLALIPTGLVVSGMQMMWYGKAPIVNFLFFPYVLLVYTPIVLGLIVLIKHYRRSRVLTERIRDSYIITGIIMMLIGGTTDYLPPLGLNMYPLGIIGNIAFCLLATIAMLRYGLLEIKVVLRRGASYSMISMLILGTFTSLILLLSNLFKELISPVSVTITILAVFAVAAAFQPVLSRLQHIVDRWFFRDRYDNLQALTRFTKEMRHVTDLKQLSSSLVTTITHAMQSRGVYLLLPSQSTGNFDTFAYYGEKSTGQLSFTANSLLIIKMKHQNSIIDNNDPEIIKIIGHDETHTLMTNQIELLAPLNTKQKLIGMLLIGEKRSKEPYSTEDRRLLHKVMSEVAINIENAHLYEKAQVKHKELKKVIDGIMHAMSLTIEARDPYTAGHQKRVASLACEIAKQMGLSEWDIEGLRITSLLHDVGKITVPAEILSKPGQI
ncbi:MAG: histidine kinase N-terminal 7TM domain-containing protein, partial [Dehalococcoidales bacterium]